jgi:hypothetical protein
LFEEILDPMEQIITKILRDFEDGFLNRRQLIQSLGLAFSAALGGKALAQTPAGKPAGAPDSPFKTVELDHISYQVNDYRVTRDFYAELMGMEVKNDNGTTQCELYFGNSMLLARNRPRPRQPRLRRPATARHVRHRPRWSITWPIESTIGIPIRFGKS